MAEENIFDRVHREAAARTLTAAKRNVALLHLHWKFNKEGMTRAEAAREASAALARSPELIEAAELEPGLEHELGKLAGAGPHGAGPHDLPRFEHGPEPRAYTDRQSRRRLVAHLRAGKRYSLRAIAEIVGTSLGTVQRDIDWVQAHRDEGLWAQDLEDSWDEEGDTSIKGIPSVGRTGIIYPPRAPKPPNEIRNRSESTAVPRLALCDQRIL